MFFLVPFHTVHDSLFPNPSLLAVHGHHPPALHEVETPAIISLQTKESSAWFLHTMSPPRRHTVVVLKGKSTITEVLITETNSLHGAGFFLRS
jgi:hypothetical protein